VRASVARFEDRDEPMSSCVIALYVFLPAVAMTLLLAWITSAPSG
jgi:hypothetical protein